jgi:hypothetical protein
MTKMSEWQSLRRHLVDLQQSVASQIEVYPQPIPACDEQFNYLLELRSQLPAELARLDDDASDGSGSAEEFIRTSPIKEALGKLTADS